MLFDLSLADDDFSFESRRDIIEGQCISLRTFDLIDQAGEDKIETDTDHLVRAARGVEYKYGPIFPSPAISRDLLHSPAEAINSIASLATSRLMGRFFLENNIPFILSQNTEHGLRHTADPSLKDKHDTYYEMNSGAKVTTPIRSWISYVNLANFVKVVLEDDKPAYEKKDLLSFVETAAAR